MNISVYWGLFIGLFLVMGCGKQEYDECPAPNDNLKILFKEKISAHPFSHSFCIVCNPSLSSTEIQAWAEDMGSSSVSEQPETPCLYAYADREQFSEGFETLEQCQSAICEGGATYNDSVSRQNGNIDLDPILGPE